MVHSCCGWGDGLADHSRAAPGLFEAGGLWLQVTLAFAALGVLALSVGSRDIRWLSNSDASQASRESRLRHQ